MPSTDITFCTGEYPDPPNGIKKCSLQKFCKRYMQHLTLTPTQREYSFFADPKDCIDNNKQLFWKEKES